jgi:hypothetical protein
MSDTDDDLFSWKPKPKKKSRAEQILDAFETFHRNNPVVWTLFKRFSLAANASGRDHYSAKAVFERLRWHIEIETNGGDVKLNNNFTAYYARLFHLAHPNLDGFFRNRTLISDTHEAHQRDRQEFIDAPAEEENGINARLQIILTNEA